MRGLKKNYMKRGHIDRQTDIADTRKNRPKGRFFENRNVLKAAKSKNSNDGWFNKVEIETDLHKLTVCLFLIKVSL